LGDLGRVDFRAGIDVCSFQIKKPPKGGS
jgi:hypothetical protein